MAPSSDPIRAARTWKSEDAPLQAESAWDVVDLLVVGSPGPPCLGELHQTQDRNWILRRESSVARFRDDQVGLLRNGEAVGLKRQDRGNNSVGSSHEVDAVC